MRTGSNSRVPMACGLLFATILPGLLVGAGVPASGPTALPVEASEPCPRSVSDAPVEGPNGRAAAVGQVRNEELSAMAPDFVDDLGVWASTPWAALALPGRGTRPSGRGDESSIPPDSIFPY